MGYDDSKAQEKRAELEALVASRFRKDSVPDPLALASALVGHLADITPPFFEPPPMELITLRSLGGRRGGATTKPGNVRLNLWSLTKAIAGGSLTVAGALGAPWMLLVGGLMIWDSLYSSLKIDLSEVHASVIWAMWRNKSDDRTVAKSEVAQLTQDERHRYGRQPLSERELNDALQDLRRMKCIDEDPDDPSRWWLREWVKVQYT